jgi:hypothetical protein
MADDTGSPPRDADPPRDVLVAAEPLTLQRPGQVVRQAQRLQLGGG